MWEKMSGTSPLSNPVCWETEDKCKCGHKTVISSLLTRYKPSVYGKIGDSGLVHPGIGLTKELLENIQVQVRGKKEPWKTYFEDMMESDAASRQPYIYLQNPTETSFSSQKVNGWFVRDSLTVYTQAILYCVTGDNVYRKNALTILRLWSQLRSENYAYFPDACIHAGIPMNRICMGAEIIRYLEFQTTAGYSDSELRWGDDEIHRFINNLIIPAVKTFMSSCDEFMNQHLYTVIGAMSGYLFMDDMDGYYKTVEWFTVNKNGKNPGFNGSIKRIFREITTIDEIGTEEGSGLTLQKPVVQHMEMGRDQAHGCGDLTNAVILARLLMAQCTRVDPVDGTVSEAENAVGIYEFLDDRILRAADFFFQYMLGYETTWVQAPFSIRNGKIVDNYIAISPNYRGRYNTINFWDLYVYYASKRFDVDLEEQYPFFYEGFMKKVPSNYFTKGRREINWNNVDGGGDFWLFIPSDMAGDNRLLANPQTDYRIEVQDRGVMVENREAMSIKSDGSIKFVRFLQSADKCRLAITTGGTDKERIAFRIRTDGAAKLSLRNGVEGSIYLPDTGDRWRYVGFTRKVFETFGDLYYIVIEDIEGSYVDIDAIDIKPDERKREREHIVSLEFEKCEADETYVTYLDAPICISFAARSSDERQPVSYVGIKLPAGAVIGKESGLLKWKPDRFGEYSFYICAEAGKTCIAKKVRIKVTECRKTAVMGALETYDEELVYTHASMTYFQNALHEIQNLEDMTSDKDFVEQLKVLTGAVKELKQVSPRLSHDSLADGTSLDYPQMVYRSTMGNEIHHLTDGQGTFCSYCNTVEGAHIIDFGPDLQVSVSRFGFQARYGFSDRLAGAMVFGSNDMENWSQLMVREAAYTQRYQEIEVMEEERENRYRYLKIRKLTEYPDALRGDISGLLEFGELRIYGNGYEIVRKMVLHNEGT